MSKGKDFRGPRKRGFDDDGPSFDSPRTFRQPRQTFDRQPMGGGFGGEFAPPPPSAGPVGNSVDAVVKWFKTDKGFGFVELGNGAGDAFLHIGALQQAGYENVPPGAKLKVLVANGVKGQQVTRVIEVDTAGAAERAPQRPAFDSPRPARRAPDLSSAVEVEGAVKWFDGAKGFGFVQASDGGKDVFVHISILGTAGISGLAEGQPVTMKVVDTQKGREAVAISLA
ncbi:DNA-binding protein [Rhodoblastus sphagnicola]|uniref:DNA-binding protein n=1 Tax=Rhodoblastus sphagnicola TaxID=333368 RepID=A0A2S6N666_9HYPH|nr:cold shock domain-containing protein [Rhodoblastus sphagnicola]PPQ30092.1 DNA-binding protein [Rhodoblastus sphagnicola]